MRGQALAAVTLSIVTGIAIGPSALVAPASAIQRDVCTGVAKCKIYAHKEVDGDGRADQIAAAVKPRNRAVVRVWTADGERLRKGFNVRLWYGTGDYGGAARFDGRKGVDILYGTTLGAHTPWYSMLTYRHGGLVREDAPDGRREWAIDAAATVYYGWWRRARHGAVTMTARWATLNRPHARWKGRNTHYQWRHADWVKVGSRKATYRTTGAAAKIAGWHVKGMTDTFYN